MCRLVAGCPRSRPNACAGDRWLLLAEAERQKYEVLGKPAPAPRLALGPLLSTGPRSPQLPRMRHRLRHGRLSPSRRRRSTTAAVRAAVRAAWHSRPLSRPLRAAVRAAWHDRSQMPQMPRRTHQPGSLSDHSTRRQHRGASGSASLRPPLASGRACMDHALCLWQGHARLPCTEPAVCLLVNLSSI